MDVPSGEPPQIRVAFGLLIALAAFRYGHDMVKLALAAPQIDFGAYYAATAALWSGLDPFDPDWVRRSGTLLGSATAESPPTFAPAGYLVFLPFLVFPYPIARVVWLVLGQACLAAALAVAYRRFAPSPALAAAGLCVALGYQPMYEDAAVGNLNLVMLLLVSLGVAPEPRTHALRAALPLSLAVTLKVNYGVLIPFLWWLGASRAALLTAALALAWSAAALLVFGTHWLGEYAHFLAVGSAHLHSWMRNLSPHALLHRLVAVDGPHVVVDALAVALALAAAGVVLWVLRQTHGRDDGPLAAMAMAVAAMPIVAPLLEEHHLTVTLLPLLFAIARADTLSGTRDIACLLGAVVLLASRYSVEAFPVFDRGLASLAYSGKALGAGLLITVIARLALKGRAHPGD